MRDFDRIAADNLSLWQTAAAQSRELCLLQAYECGKRAGESCRAGSIQDRAALRMECPDLPTAAQVPPCTGFARFLSIEEQIAFCRGLLQTYPDFSGEERAPALPPPPASPKVAFLDSFFGREALRRFEGLLPHPRPMTAASFSAVCELLADDRADFAMLPLGDSLEGRFLHLHEEIDRFELHITHTCDILYPNEGRAVTMALLSKRYQPTAKVASTRLLTCRIFAQDGAELTDILHAASTAGLILRRVNSDPAPYGEDGIFYHIIFESEEQAERLLEAYLAIRHPRARATGHYYHLK